MLFISGRQVHLAPMGSRSNITMTLAVVLRAEHGQLTMEAMDRIPVQAGSAVGIYLHHDRQFMRQQALVHSMLSSQTRTILVLTPKGELEPANLRETYRVGVAGSGLQAIVNEEFDCPALDMHSGGLGIASPCEMAIGTSVHVDLRWATQRCQGVMDVVSSKRMPDGRYRLGLRVRAKDALLHSGLKRIAGEIERAQLRRLQQLRQGG